jgi:ribulose-phosphate 3-epimerase
MGWSDWAREVEVEPSLYGADLARLGEQVDELLDAGVHVFHFDVGDGHFVESITMGTIVLQAISERIHRAGAALDVHLMVERPAEHFGAFAKAGADSVTFHFEAVDDVAATTAVAREHSLAVGLAFNPESDPADVAAVAEGVDLVCSMSYERVRELRSLLPADVRIQVDGGVGADNIARLREEGASLFVATDDPVAAYRGLEQAIS